mgnify:CR=1 FL=1
MSRDERGSSGLGFWGFALALIAGYYVLSIEPTTIELAAGPEIVATTAPPTTAPPPVRLHTHTPPTAPPGRFASGGRDLPADDSLTDNMRQFAECMVTDPFGPIYCAGKTAGEG